MPQRLILRGILGAVLLLTVMLGSVVVWLWTQSPLTLLRAQPDIPPVVRLLPQSTTALFVLNTPIEQLQDLIQSATPSPNRRALRRRQEQVFSPQAPGLLGQLFSAGDLDFTREVQPWLGDEIIWALAPVADPSPAQPTPELGSLLVLSTRDFERSLLFLNVLWQRQELAGVPLDVSVYKGVEMVTLPMAAPEALQAGETRPPGKELTGAAFTKNYLLFADDRRLLQRVIDTWERPQLSLISSPAYQKVLKSFEQPRVGWAFLQLQDPLTAPAKTASLQSLGLSLRPSFRGLVSETHALWSLPGEKPALVSPTQSRSSLLQCLPHSTIAFVSGQHLGKLWQTLRQLQPIAGLDLATALRALEQGTDLNWQKDLFAWMDQDFAFALLPSDPDTGPNWFLVAQVQDQDLTPQQRLDLKVASLGLQILPVPLKNPAWGEAIAWVPESFMPADLPEQSEENPEGDLAQSAPSTSIRWAQIPSQTQTQGPSPDSTPAPDSEKQPERPAADLNSIEIEPEERAQIPALAYHLNHQGYFFLTTSLTALEQVLGDEPLSGSEIWKRATPFLDPQNQGYVFLNVQDGIDWLTQVLPPESEPMGWLQQIQRSDLGLPESLTLVTTQITPCCSPAAERSGPWVQEGQMFIRLGA